MELVGVMRLAIVGGGLGGCALAIAAAQHGISAVIIEKDPGWTPLSSGIFLYANGLDSVRKLGVLDEVLANGWSSPDGKNIYYDQNGEIIAETYYPTSMPGVIPPIVGIMRSTLHKALVAQVRKLGVRVILGSEVARFHDSGTGLVEVELTKESSESCDILVGADGIRSSIRRELFGPITPEFTGFGTWRSLHAKPKNLDAKIMMMGVGKRLGIMPLSDTLMYIYATTNEPDNPRYQHEFIPSIMREKLKEFGGPATDLLPQIQDPTTVFYTAVEEVALGLPWSKGRVVLIGDAAHASTPYMGQGGAMALEDGLILAEMLSVSGANPDTLLAFGERRYERCSFVQRVSRSVGDKGGLESAADCEQRNVNLRETGQLDVDNFYKRMFAGN
jgi:2-polyprenyl-6-methoxyphenol hydroxylase-like FAD-dependent oxidoreductase